MVSRTLEKDEHSGLMLGLVNDGIASVPGVLRISIVSRTGQKLSEGSLDPGYPHPRKVRQAMFLLPKETQLEGVKLYAELELKGIRYKVNWACHQKTEADRALVVRRNL
jgi:hypothetical protein